MSNQNFGPWRNPTIDDNVTGDFRRVMNAPCNGVDFVPTLLMRIANGVKEGGQIVGPSEGQYMPGTWQAVHNLIAFINAGGLNTPLPEQVVEAEDAVNA